MPFGANMQELALDFVSGDDSDSEFPTIHSLPDRQTISLSVRAAYTNWNPREAFRELVQNWSAQARIKIQVQQLTIVRRRDGIITSFALPEKEFVVECESRIGNGCTEVIYKVPRPNSTPKEWLGFIHYKAQGKVGTVEITNRTATLHPWHLDMGGTSKSGSGNLAGAHGEGLKVAMLVLMRGNQNHKIRCRSGGFSWTFNFTKHGRLVARLNRMSAETIGRLETQTRSKLGEGLLPFSPNAKSDVQFVLGEPHHGRSDLGVPTRRNLIKPSEFEAWTEAALFLQEPRPDELVKTGSGDLLIGERFRHRLYLKGLLLSEDTSQRWASVTNKPLRYGYNFAAGTTNRERQSVAGAYEESATIITIWSKALALRPDLASEFSVMLNSKQQYADVDGAGACIGRKTAQILRNYLLGHSKHKIWYYSPEEKQECPRLDDILYGLGYEGFELSQLHWNFLRQHDFLRTADEEQCVRFKLAAPSSVSDDGFAMRVKWLLQAAVRACGLARDIVFRFVRAGALDLHSLYVEDEKLFLIHERLVLKEGIADALGLPQNLRTADFLFHAVNRIFTDFLEQLPADAFSIQHGAKPVEWQRRMHVRLMEQRFFDFFRLETIQVRTQPSELTITTKWLPDDWAPGTAIEVQCHTLSCADELRKNVMIGADALSSKMLCLSGSGVLPRTGEQVEFNRQSETCRVLQTTISDMTRHVMALTDKQEYMLLFLLPSEAGSFVSWRTVPSAGQQGQTAVSVVQETCSNHSPEIFTTPICDEVSGYSPLSPGYGRTADYDCFSPSWSSTADPFAVCGTNDESKEKEPVLSSVKDCSRSHSTEYELGARLEKLDFLAVSAWYEGKEICSRGKKAVIGLFETDEVDYTPKLKRKRHSSSCEQARGSRPHTSILVE